MNKRPVTFGIFSIDDVLSPAECAETIAWSEAQSFEDAPINQTQHLPEVRNNMRVMTDDLARAHDLFRRVELLLEPTVGPWRLDDLNERLRFYRYDVGQRFDWHRDGVFERPSGERSFFTFMIYLNDDFDGGATAFLDGTTPGGVLRVKPRAGSALVFRHDLPVHHTGEEVTRGRKYVLRSDVMYRREG